MRTDDLDFHLPPELIAQEPAARRVDARLLCYDRLTQRIEHSYVRDMPELLRRGDLLVFNHTTVVPARFTVRKPSGGRLEGLWLSTESCAPFRRGRVLLKGLGRFEPGVQLSFEADPSATLTVLQKSDSDGYEVEASENLNDLVRRLGRMPLPPYIKRKKGQDERDADDRKRYQTVFHAAAAASVAAPTAGLHFDNALLECLNAANIHRTSVELQVGLGTFKPVDVDDLDDHPMHRERWEIQASGGGAIND
ncbi:MAG: S-adenosylmethionine:tRNA ribosyltransferase-isomerase, partial [Planctomycetota bacterium]